MSYIWYSVFLFLNTCTMQMCIICMYVCTQFFMTIILIVNTHISHTQFRVQNINICFRTTSCVSLHNSFFK